MVRFVFFFVLLAAIGCGGKKGQSSAAVESAADAAAPRDAIEVGVVKLFYDYRAELAADKQYRGRQLLMHVVVDSSKRKGNGALVVFRDWLITVNDNERVDAYFPSAAAVESLRESSLVWIVGTCQGLHDGRVLLTDCRIVPDPKEPQ